MSEYWVGLDAPSLSSTRGLRLKDVQTLCSVFSGLRVWDGHISLLFTFQHGSIANLERYLLHETGYPTISWLIAFFCPQNGHAMAGYILNSWWRNLYLRFKKRNGDTLKGALAFIPWAVSPASWRSWCSLSIIESNIFAPIHITLHCWIQNICNVIWKCSYAANKEQMRTSELLPWKQRRQSSAQVLQEADFEAALLTICRIHCPRHWFQGAHKMGPEPKSGCFLDPLLGTCWLPKTQRGCGHQLLETSNNLRFYQQAVNAYGLWWTWSLDTSLRARWKRATW